MANFKEALDSCSFSTYLTMGRNSLGLIIGLGMVLLKKNLIKWSVILKGYLVYQDLIIMFYLP